jgi:hypothetical protein
MRVRFPLMLLACSLAAPALADKNLDPDPAFLAKARTAATATVEPHYDLVSEKVPFWARSRSGEPALLESKPYALDDRRPPFDFAR